MPWQLLSRHVKDVETTINSKWRSQPFIHGKHPARNIMMSFSTILMSISAKSSSCLPYKHMGLSAICPRTYFAQQKNVLFPVIFMHWERYRAALVEQVKSVQGAQWSGDGRFDSMGHNAKYGVYPMYCNSISKLVHFELLQVLYRKHWMIITLVYIIYKTGY